MQGQSSGVGSLPETLNFDHGSSSGNTAVDQQICWNNIQNPLEDRMSDYLLLQQSDVNLSYVNAGGREQQSLSRWSIDQASSSGGASEMGCNERKAELGWTPATPCVGHCPMLDSLRYGASNNFPLDSVSVNPLFIQGSNSGAIPPNLSLNAGYIGHNVNECPIIFKASGLENEGILPPTSGSDSFLPPSESGSLSLEGSDGRTGSLMEGRRLSCKRKAFEGSSISGSTSYSQSADKTVIPSCSNASSNFVSFGLPDQANQRLRLGPREVVPDGLSDSHVAETTENADRNFHLRISSSNQSGSTHPSTTSSVSTRQSRIASSQFPNRLPVNYSLNLRSAQATEAATTQNPPFVLRIPPLPRSVLSSRVSEGRESLNSRTGGSFGLVGDRRDMQREDAASSSTARIVLENPPFVPATESRNLTRNPPNRRRHGGNLIIPGNVPSTSRTRSTMVSHPPSGSWLLHENSFPPQYPSRLSEYVRRQLFSTLESGGSQPNNLSSLNSGPFSQDMLLSGTGNQGHHSSLSRVMPWIERQGEGALGIPDSLRSIAAPGEGSGGHRLVSEIRNVLGLMRRGENVRLEDVMILDHSVLFGVADFHDRHRDMRLDVDNMSYEDLLALEERIGNVSTGLSEETILSRLKQSKCSPVSGSPMEEEPCCICQEAYMEGEDVGKLDCGHEYHTGCIKQWLMIKNLCPICKTTALPT